MALWFIATIADFQGGDVIISQGVVAWFEGRGISAKTLEDTGIYSGQHIQSGDDWKVVPSNDDSAIVVFPYLRKGEEVNAKYRGRGKKFYQKPNGVKTFFNADVLDDPLVQDGTNSLVITEGEMDTLSCIEAGYPYVVSVPDGAPPPAANEVDENPDLEHDTKYGYIFNNWEQLRGLRRIIIATDCDDPGRRLAEELVRRLGRVRCQFVTYPAGSKDLNEVLLNHGKDAVLIALRTAQPYPIKGVYTFSELPPEPKLVPLSTGWGRLDCFLRPYFHALMVVTGIPGAGKSIWVNQLVAQMSILHRVSVAIASFEMRIKPFISDTLINTYKDMTAVNRGLRNNIAPLETWLEESFVFIAPEPTDNDDEYHMDWLIERASEAVIRYGCRILVVDPWNEIEHVVGERENHSAYIGKAIKALKRFGRVYEVLVIVVAHPAKYGGQKDPQDLSLYDISDSAHFFNKCDFGVVLHRIQGSNETNVMVKKVRHQTLTGKLGIVPITYSEVCQTFSQ